MVCQRIVRVHSDDALGDVSRRADQRFVATLDEDNVGTGEVAVMPVLLGEGIPLLPSPARQVKLKLVGSKVFKSGIVSLEYAIEYGSV